MALEFTVTEKGNRKLIVNGYMFVKDRVTDTKIYWKCEKFAVMKCHARVHTEADRVVKHVGEHNHAADVASVEAAKVVRDATDRALTSQDSGHQIVAQASVGISAAVAAKLPQPSSWKRSLRRARRTGEVALPTPQSRSELQIPREIVLLDDGEQFLKFDSGAGEDRILIFSTERNLRLLTQSPHWYCDGTFKTCPPLFTQIYSVHSIVDKRVLPAIFALLPSKSEDTYSRLFAQMKNMLPTANPDSVMTDFESATVNAFHYEYPNTTQRGCFFHFTQCLYRKIQDNGLQHKYCTEADFALTMRMLSGLAFVPVPEVIAAFDRLCDSGMFPAEAQPVLDYFEDNWIGRPQRRNRRRAPRFQHSLWNCYDSVSTGLPKTNNALEGWHRGFAELLSCNHPTIWKFIKALKTEQAKNDLCVEQSLAGQQPPLGRKKYRDCAQRITRIVEQYGQIDIVDYLRGLAHNFNF